jgi:hypothetical protein
MTTTQNATPEVAPYDSAVDTLLHMRRVNTMLMGAAIELMNRGNNHDLSKLGEQEKPVFDKYTPALANTTYGSPEYNENLQHMQVALQHHYLVNSHHPEHYKTGMMEFDLFDLMEMFFDWCAATERHTDGDIIQSIAGNAKRFGYPPMLTSIFMNTAYRYYMARPQAVVETPAEAAPEDTDSPDQEAA